MNYEVCPICGSPSVSDPKLDPFRNIVSCDRCSKFILTETGQNQIDYLNNANKITKQVRANISGWIREHQGEDVIINKEKLISFTQMKNLNVFEKADKILLYLSKQYPVGGYEIPFENNDFVLIKEIDRNGSCFYPIPQRMQSIAGIGRIIDLIELKYIWLRYLIEEKNYISSSSINFIITPKGWAHIETLKQSNPNSRKAFVAMWFDDEMFEMFDNYIAPAVQEAGFNEPKHIGKKEHNNDINDEIIAEIRSSRFVVADFTGNRGGVYYEAGFAYGLNIPVIHTCRKDHLKNVHFDINHRNIIVWETGEDLYKRLLNRIKATII